MTLQEYFATPETVLPQELIYGEMRVVAESPTTTHQAVVGALFLTLHAHVTQRRLGSVWLAPLDVVLDPDRALVLQPDLLVVRHDGAAMVSEKVYGPPDLVIEVLSPRPRIGELVERVGWFRDHGVRECWLVHHLERRMEVIRFADRRITQRRSFGADDAIESGVLPDFDMAPVAFLGYRPGR